MKIRPAEMQDEAALARIDAATWTTEVSPAPARLGDDFFARIDMNSVLVAEVDGQAVGYAVLRQGAPIPSHAHVLDMNGLAVDPEHQGRGIGRALVEATVAAARQQGARKLTLRVLGFNGRARRLYEACGFHIEGVLREEFLLDGRYVDDVFMARMLKGEGNG
ncbi:MAG TPA: GNAT family N-acetyltransferase [Streptosporangiaceae bacterium]|nr:GNAT family N-acetyltransferase [Streptosporangiaceae bacterium]